MGAKNRLPAPDDPHAKQLRVGFDTPNRLGGVSGAGVWHIEAHPTDDRLVYHLECIVYYDYRTRERRYLRAHDSLSLPRILSKTHAYGTHTLSNERWAKFFSTYPDAN